MADISEEDLHLFVMQRREIEQLEDRLKQVKADHRALSSSLHDQIQQQNLKSVPHTELGRFTPIAKLYVHLARPAIDDEGETENENARQELENWSKDQIDPAGHSLFDELFYWAIRNARLKQLVKDRLGENLDPPPGIDHGYIKDIQWTKPK
jgi:hypothetical protein